MEVIVVQNAIMFLARVIVQQMLAAQCAPIRIAIMVAVQLATISVKTAVPEPNPQPLIDLSDLLAI